MSLFQVVQLASSDHQDTLLGTIVECNKNGIDKVVIRLCTPLFHDYKYITLSANQFNPILCIDPNSTIHNYGVVTLSNFEALKVIFKEPVLIPFAPRIQQMDKNDKIITNDVIKWWKSITLDSNRHKFNVFCNLSYHNKGPIVDNVDKFLMKNKLIFSNKGIDDSELKQIRRALLIDGANTFDQGTYEIICRLNHCCDPSVMVTINGEVISLRHINKNEELTWNFLNDRYLYSNIIERNQILYNIYGFICNCFRCNAHFDDSRIFLCINCSKTSVFVSYEISENDNVSGQGLNIATTFHDCFECNYSLKPHEINYYLSMEKEIDKLIQLCNEQNQLQDNPDVLNEYDFKEKIKHLRQYLSDQHFKWFGLWYEMLLKFNDNNDKIFGKSLKYVLIHCYKSANKIFNNCQNYCKFNIERKLLNYFVNEILISKYECKKREKILINKLFHSISRSKDFFKNYDNVLWKKIHDVMHQISNENKRQTI